MDLKEMVRAFYPVSDASIAEMKRLMTLRRVPKGKCIVQQGVASREMYYIAEGLFRNYTTVDGEEHTQWFAQDGDFVTSMFSFSQSLPAVSSIEALTDAKVYVLSLADARRLIMTNDEWARWTALHLIDGLFVLERRNTFLRHGDALRRYCNFVRMRSVNTSNKIPLKYIASYLSMTPPTLSRIRSKVAECPELLEGELIPKIRS